MSYMDGKILFYEGPHYYLSNFSAFAVRLKGLLWMTAEHLYQAHKFFWLQDGRITDAIFHAPSAHEAKQITKVHKDQVFPEFDQVKLAIMEAILRAKFNQHPYIQRKLLETGNLWLVEDSPKDSFWGRGPDWEGRNQLGVLWMKIRTEAHIKEHEKKMRC